MSDDKKPDPKKGDDNVTVPERTMKVETEVNVQGLPEFQAAIESEKKKAQELEAKLKTETEARQKAEQDKIEALKFRADVEEKERQAKIVSVKTKFGDQLPEEVYKDLPRDKLDHLISDRVPAPKKDAETPPQKKEEGQSKAPPPGGAPSPETKKKKQPWFNRDGMAYPAEDKVGERGKQHEVAKQRCEVHEKAIAEEIRKRSGRNTDEE